MRLKSSEILTNVVCLCLILSTPAAAAKNPWPVSSPAAEGMDSTILDSMKDTLAARGTKGLLILRNDKVVYEWYAPPPDHGPAKPHYTASLAKALVGGMSLLLALNDNLIDADDPAYRYIPAWRNDPVKRRITIRHLATHSSGIEDAETPGLTHFQQTGWKLAFWKREPDPFSVAVNQAPVVFPPGTSYAYSNPGMAALAYAVTAAIGNAPQPDIKTLLKERIMDPLGVPDNHWSIGYGQGYEVDGMTLYANWGGGDFTARATAAVGNLMLHRGRWQGRELIEADWVEKVTSYAGTPIPERTPGNPSPASGLGWWTNFDRVWAKVPADSFAGAGAGNQVLLVVPSLGLVVVRNGALIGDPAAGVGFWGGIEKYLFNPIMESLN